MGIINWLAAPVGATAYQPSGPEQYEGWYRKNECGEVMWWQVGRQGKEQWAWMGGRRDYPYGAVIRPAERVTVKIEPGNGALGAVVAAWNKAPLGTMGFHPAKNGYVDHWVKWEDSGDNWFCVCGFEKDGWQKAITKLGPWPSQYTQTIVRKPGKNQAAVYCELQLNAWQEYANNFRQTIGVQSAQEAKLRGEISLQVFAAGFDAGVKSATVGK